MSHRRSHHYSLTWFSGLNLMASATVTLLPILVWWHHEPMRSNKHTENGGHTISPNAFRLLSNRQQMTQRQWIQN